MLLKLADLQSPLLEQIIHHLKNRELTVLEPSDCEFFFVVFKYQNNRRCDKHVFLFSSRAVPLYSMFGAGPFAYNFPMLGTLLSFTMAPITHNVSDHTFPIST